MVPLFAVWKGLCNPETKATLEIPRVAFVGLLLPAHFASSILCVCV
jgi:hypothetical protein